MSRLPKALERLEADTAIAPWAGEPDDVQPAGADEAFERGHRAVEQLAGFADGDQRRRKLDRCRGMRVHVL